MKKLIFFLFVGFFPSIVLAAPGDFYPSGNCANTKDGASGLRAVLPGIHTIRAFFGKDLSAEDLVQAVDDPRTGIVWISDQEPCSVVKFDGRGKCDPDPVIWQRIDAWEVYFPRRAFPVYLTLGGLRPIIRLWEIAPRLRGVTAPGTPINVSLLLFNGEEASIDRLRIELGVDKIQDQVDTLRAQISDVLEGKAEVIDEIKTVLEVQAEEIVRLHSQIEVLMAMAVDRMKQTSPGCPAGEGEKK